MRRREGFILAEALVSVAVATLTGALALTLLVWTARTLDRAKARMEAAALVEQLYEQARLASPDELNTVIQGRSGRYAWRRRPLGPLDARFPTAAERLRLEVVWTAGGRPGRSTIEAIVTGAGE